MLKLYILLASNQYGKAAAFERLCVETNPMQGKLEYADAQPPSGGCVLKRQLILRFLKNKGSRLRAAVC